MDDKNRIIKFKFYEIYDILFYEEVYDFNEYFNIFDEIIF